MAVNFFLNHGYEMAKAPSYLMLVAELLETKERLLNQVLPTSVKDQLTERIEYLKTIDADNLPESCKEPVSIITRKKSA
jgi:hypothetical protein